MKKTFSVIIALTLAFAFILSSCGTKNSNTPNYVYIDGEESDRKVEIFSEDKVKCIIERSDFEAYKAVADSYIEKYSLAHGIEEDTVDESSNPVYSDRVGVSRIEFFDWDVNGTVEMLIVYSENPCNYYCAEKLDIYTIENSQAKLILSEDLGMCYGTDPAGDGFNVAFVYLDNKVNMIVHDSTEDTLCEKIYTYSDKKIEKNVLEAKRAKDNYDGFTDMKIDGSDVKELDFMSIFSKFADASWDQLYVTQNSINTEYTLKFLNGEIKSYSFDRAYPCWNAYSPSEHTSGFYACKAFITNLNVK